jgi:acetyl esterase/lipase
MTEPNVRSAAPAGSRSRPRFHRWLIRLVTGLGLILLLAITGAATLWGYLHPGFEHRQGIVYAQRHGHDLTFDILRPGRPNGIGIILINSGSWKSNPHGFRAFLAAPLLRRGHTVFVVSHLSQPHATVMEIIDDLHRATRFIRYHAADYSVDPNRIGVCGGSAGGHLSLMLATRGGPGPADAPDPIDRQSSAVQAVAIFFPVTDLLNLGASTENPGDGGPPRSFVRAFGPQSTNPPAWKVIGHDTSPIYHLTSNLPPVLIHHGDSDTLTPLEQSRWFVERAQEVGARVTLHVHRGGKHGWLTMPWDIHQFARWFDQNLRVTP